MNTINDSRKLTLILGIVVAVIALAYLLFSDSKDANTVLTITDFSIGVPDHEAGHVLITHIAEVIFY
jgi:hypothetical protein